MSSSKMFCSGDEERMDFVRKRKGNKKKKER